LRGKGGEPKSKGVSGVEALAIEMDVKLPLLRKRHDADIVRSGHGFCVDNDFAEGLGQGHGRKGLDHTRV